MPPRQQHVNCFRRKVSPDFENNLPETSRMARGASYNLDELIWKNRGESRNTGCPRLASLIRDARESASLSADQLAQMLRVDAARVDVWETGTEGMSRGDVEALRTVFPDTNFSAVRYRPTPHHGEIAHIPTD
jgi:ribosome-binding protein aMBF1 (putative translation factor)